MPELVRACQCKRWSDPCTDYMSQEDFLCDNCRAGCAGLSVNDSYWIHVGPVEFKFAPDGTAAYKLGWPDT
jgi:hypothetical protein